ncbi:gluzincin family metallopeptidase [Sinomicrobium sp.]
MRQSPRTSTYNRLYNTLNHLMCIAGYCCLFIATAGLQPLCAQNRQTITARLHPETHTINIQQEIVFHNNSADTLNNIYLSDWNNAYSGKNTALAKRFGEEFDKSLHLAKEEVRGFTKIIDISDKNFHSVHWERSPSKDLVNVQLNFPVYPGGNALLKLSYTVKLPSDSFTRYGYDEQGNYRMRYWYLTPAVYNGEEWVKYSNKNLDDLYTGRTDYKVIFNYPEDYTLTSDLDIEKDGTVSGIHQTVLRGDNRYDVKLYLEKINSFERYSSGRLSLVTNLQSDELTSGEKAFFTDRIGSFIDDHLGPYPHQKLMVTETEYLKNPLYGLNQLPDFLRPFPEHFQYELKLLKTTLNNYLENTLFLDTRKDKWIADAIQIYLMIKYVETYYPDMKLLGKLSNWWLVRSFHLAEKGYNDQYPLLFMLMLSKNIDQALATPKDELIKFNEKIAGKYKAGLGLIYLENYLSDGSMPQTIKKFYRDYRLKSVSVVDFEKSLKENSYKNIDWFFDEYVSTRNKIDFTIKKVKKTSDSIWVTVRNKERTNVPISLFGVRNDTVLSKYWFANIAGDSTFRIPNNNEKRLVLNYDKIIPEFNQRDNWKSLRGFFSQNRRLKFQFFKDAENPYYNQIFYVPTASYNFYDGVVMGMRLHNKTFTEKPFLIDVVPSLATKNKSLVGSGVIGYRNYLNSGNLYLTSFSLRGSSYHYAKNLRYSTITPTISLGFRTDDFRSNIREALTLRFVNVIREKDETVVSDNDNNDPDYSVFNARYSYSNNGIINYFSWFSDLQVANNFSKLSFDVEYRKLYQNNSQLNIRLFAGKFIYNDTSNDYFSFALDRPTDYLFDFGYLGRSETSGILSQQIIIAEGGFKSKFRDPYANDWMVTTNASFNIWKWVELYGDLGVIKSKYEPARFVYDSGIRLNLVTDYFELYFPIYSNNGWEIAQQGYDQKIRFIVTLQPRTLLKLFTRKWF